MTFHAYFIQAHDVPGGRIHYTVIDHLAFERPGFIVSVLISRSGEDQEAVLETVRRIAEERYPLVAISSAMTFTFQLKRAENDKTIAEQLRHMADKLDHEAVARGMMARPTPVAPPEGSRRFELVVHEKTVRNVTAFAKSSADVFGGRYTPISSEEVSRETSLGKVFGPL